MTHDQPTPGEPLNGESVRLLLPGDVLRFNDRIVTFAGLWKTTRGTQGIKRVGGSQLARFYTFVSRPQPSGGQDGGGEVAELLAMLDDYADRYIGATRGEDMSLEEMLISKSRQAFASPAKATGWPSREDVALAIFSEAAHRFMRPSECEPIADRVFALFPRPENEGAA